MPANYKYYDSFGKERTVPNVLDQVSLTGVETTSGSNLITVASTTGLFQGMPVACPNIPQGAFIHAIRSATVIELWASLWNAATGYFATTAANANATASGSGLLATASGFCPRTLITHIYAQGTWRNTPSIKSCATSLPSISSTLATGAATVLTAGYGEGVAIIPSAGTISSGNYIPTTYEIFKSDELTTTPLHRHKGEPWPVLILVSTGGHKSLIAASPGREILYAGAST